MELRLRRETRPRQQPPASNPRKLMNILHPPFLPPVLAKIQTDYDE